MLVKVIMEVGNYVRKPNIAVTVPWSRITLLTAEGYTQPV